MPTNFSNLDAYNPIPRCPVVLLLDASGSMRGEPIRELAAGLRQFIQETREDEAASMSVDLEVVLFGGSDQAKTTTIIPFTPLLDVKPPTEHVAARGGTFIGEALDVAYRDLMTRRSQYRQLGLYAYRPWVILMTDGRPGDKWQEPARRFRELAEQGKVQFLGIAIGKGADLDIMAKMLPANAGPVLLKQLRFKQFFKWLSDSMASISCCSVDTEDQARIQNPCTWMDGLDTM